MLKPWFDKITGLITPFEKAMVDQLHTHAVRAEETALRNQLRTTMIRTVRDFKAGLIRRVARDNQPEIVLQYYRMPHQKTPKTTEDWYQLGQWLQDGEAKARSKKFPAMTNPTVRELKKA